MKFLKIVCIALICFSCTGCATMFGGPLDVCQKSKPAKGEKRRSIRILALVLDIPFGLITDFTTGAIYKPCNAPPPGTADNN